MGFLARFLGGLGIGAVVTVSLFIIMGIMVYVTVPKQEEVRTSTLANFISEKKEIKVEARRRAKPRQVSAADKPPPPPKLSASKTNVKVPAPRIAGAAPKQIRAERVSSIGLGNVFISDRDATPVRPPSRRILQDAADKGLYGSCEVELNVNPAGIPIDVVATCDNSRLKRYAERAVAKAEFAPKIRNGKKVGRSGVVYPITFQEPD